MKKSTFSKRLEKLLQTEEDFWYSQCETVQEKVNFYGQFTSITDTTRIFFFTSTNTVVLVDRPNGYKEAFRNPSAALREIGRWIGQTIYEKKKQSLKEDAESLPLNF